MRACLVTGSFRLRMGDHAEPVLFVVRGPALCGSGPPCICGPDVPDGHELRGHGHDRSGQHGGHGRRGRGRFHLEPPFPAGHRLPAFPAGHECPSGGRRTAPAHPAPAAAGHLAHPGHQRHPDDRLLRHLLAFAVLRAGRGALPPGRRLPARHALGPAGLHAVRQRAQLPGRLCPHAPGHDHRHPGPGAQRALQLCAHLRQAGPAPAGGRGLRRGHGPVLLVHGRLHDLLCAPGCPVPGPASPVPAPAAAAHGPVLRL